MAYGVKYRIEFNSILNRAWKIEILEDGYSSTVTDLLATGDPLHFEFDSDSDIFSEPVRPSKVVFNVYSQTNFQLTDLYTDEEFKFKVNIYRNDSLWWFGWMAAGQYEEPYTWWPYPVSLTAIDQLSYLKNILFADSVSVSGGAETITYYDGHWSESQIIYFILLKTGTGGFREYINIFEDSMNQTTDNSPLDQCFLDVDLFRDWYCWDVLTEILKKYNAVLRQANASWVIYRPTELILSMVYGRIFSDASTKDPTFYNPDQFIDRIATPSGLRQMPDSVMMTKRPAKKVTLTQDYGYKKSIIDNWEIRGNTLKGNTIIWNLQMWYKTNALLIQPPVLIGESDGVMIVDHNTYPTLDRYLFQSFGSHLKATTDIFFLEFDYLIWNGSGTARTGQDFYIELSADSSSHYLYGVGTDQCQWSNSVNRLILSCDAPIETSGWQTFKRSVPGIPVDGPYTIAFFGLNSPEPLIYPVIKNVRFYCTADAIVTKTRKRSSLSLFQTGFGVGLPLYFFSKIRSLFKYKYKDIEDNPEIVSKDYILSTASPSGTEINETYLLGDVIDSNIDNVVEQFQGAITTGNPATTLIPSSVWQTINPGGENRPLLEIIGGEIGLQYSRPKQLIQMNIRDDAGTVSELTKIGPYYNWYVTQKFHDWYLPSKDELNQMYLNLYLSGVGDLYPDGYPSSSEFSASAYWIHMFVSNTQTSTAKSNGMNVRPIRSFTTSSSTDYAIRDTGPADGLIFYINDNGDSTYTYFECCDRDINLTSVVGWSNVSSLAGTALEVGEGKNNTDLIITQSAADLMATRCKALTTHDICPTGWHVHLNSEATTLRTYIDPVGSGITTNVAGIALKEIGFINWKDSGNPSNNGINTFGFNARGAGQRDSSFSSLNEAFLIWSSTLAYGGFNGVCAVINYNATYFAESGQLPKHTGLSLRLIKNTTTKTNGQTGTVIVDGITYNTICIGTQEWLSENLKAIHYNDGKDIAEVVGNAAWAALKRGAYSWRNNIPE